MLKTSNLTKRFQALSFEEAQMLLVELTDVEIFEVSGADLYVGKHEERGQVCLFIPGIGESILISPADFLAALQ